MNSNHPSYSRLILILGLILSSKVCFNQSRSIDSLKVLLETASPGADQVDYLMGIAREHLFLTDYEGLKNAVDQGKVIAQEYNDLAGLSGLLIMENIYTFGHLGDGNKAFDISAEALKIARQSGDKDAIAFATYQHAENHYYEKGEVEIALDLLRESIASFDESVTNKNQGNTYKNLAVMLSAKGQHEEALPHFETALDLFDKVDNQPDILQRLGRISAMYASGGLQNAVQAMVYFAETYEALGRIEEAESTLFTAYDMIKNEEQKDALGWICESIASLYRQTGDYTNAIKYYQEGLQLHEESNSGRDIAIFQTHLGDVFMQVEEYDEAYDYFTKAYGFFAERKDTIRSVHVAAKQADALLTADRLDEAQRIVEDVRKQAEQFGAAQILNQAWIISSKVNRKLGNYNEANLELEKVLTNARSSNDQALEAETLIRLMQINMDMDNSKEAVALGEQSLSIIQNLELSNMLSSIYEHLSKAHENLGDFESSLTFFKSYHENESDRLATDAQAILRQEQVRQNVNEFKEEKEAADLQSELLASRNRLYLGLSAMLLLILLVGGYLARQLRNAKISLEEKNQQLVELNKTKDRFFSIIGHDIRSPIVALEGVGEQMDFYLKKNKTDKLQNLSKKISSTAKNLTSLLDNLLNWALLQQGVIPYHPDRISLNEAVDRTIDMFKMNAGVKEIEVMNGLSEELFVKADESSLNTILRNLISNAIKFTKKGGQINVNAQVVGSHIKVHVKDSGIGITQEKLSRIFDLNTKSNKGTDGERGTGLGLVLCKELAELNKGRIEVESQEDKGSDFFVTFPIAA